MTIQELQSRITSNDIPHILIFTGEEIEVQNIYIKELVRRSQTLIQRVDSVDSILDRLKRKSFLNRNLCVVVRDDKSFTQDEKLQSVIAELIEDNILILLYTNLDKRTKFYKKYKEDIIEFNPLSEQLLTKYIQRDTGLTKHSCAKLIDMCESSYGRILLEIDKIKHYLQAVDPTGDDLSWDRGFEILVDDGLIYQPPKDAIFDFVNAVLRRKPALAFELLQESYDCGEATMVLLSVLYTNVKQLLQVQSCESSNVEKSTGLTSWQIKCVSEYKNKYSTGELVQFLRLIQFAESGIKQGIIEDMDAVKYILVKIM